MNNKISLALVLLLFAASPAFAAETFTARPSERTVTLSGFTRARATMELVSENSGRVKKVQGEIGDEIAADGVFARLDATFTRLELESNRVEQKKLQETIAYYDKEADRYRRLVSSESAALAKLDELDHQLATARRELESLKVQEKVLIERLSRYTVRARAGWKVIERDVEPGEWVAAGQVLGRAGDYRTLVVPFALAPDEYESLMRDSGDLSLALPEKRKNVPASIHRVSPGFDRETRKIGVELAIDENALDGGKRGGIRCMLHLTMTDETDAVIVPASAVIERYEEHWLTRDGGEEVRVVVLGPGPAGENPFGSAETLRVSAPDVLPGQIFLTDPDNR
jgi:RND family efflux transporter MFP subunit